MACTLTIIADPGAASDAALRRARQALAAAEAAGRAVDIVHALGVLAHCYLQRRVPEVAEALFEQALRWSRATVSPDLVVDLLCDLAEFSLQQAMQEGGATIADAADKARAYAAEASDLAGQVSDPVFELRVLLRIGRLRDHLGDTDEAQALRARAEHLMQVPPRTPEPSGPAIQAPAHPTVH